MTSVLTQLKEEKPLRLHPVYDMNNGILSFGFSVDSSAYRDWKKLIHVVSVRGKVGHFEGNSGVVDNQTIRHRSHTARAPDLSTHWPRQDVLEFLNNPSAPRGVELYDELVAAWQQYVDLEDPGMYVIAATWGVLTYVYPAFAAVPFLHFLGPKGSGKSQSLDLLQQLARQGYKARATAAVVGDLIESKRVTLLLDQADNLSPHHIDLFADSYRAGAKRAIVDMDHRGSPLEFETFGPKAFAGTKPLPDDLQDRAIMVTTTPTEKKLLPVVLGNSQFAALRAKSYRWALLNSHRLPELRRDVESNGPFLDLLTGRQRELWLPMEVLMGALEVPSEGREEARAYYERSHASTKAELPEEDVQLLSVLLERVGSGKSFDTTSEDLLHGLNPQDELGNAEMTDDQATWTPQKLGCRLRSLGVLCRPSRRVDRNRVRQYVIDGVAVRTKASRLGVTID